MERKKIGQIQGIISRRRLVCNPMIQHVIINLYTKYDFSSLQGCGEIFDEKVLRNYGRTDGRTDGRADGMTERCKPGYPTPTFSKRGIINNREEKHYSESLSEDFPLENLLYLILPGRFPILHMQNGNSSKYTKTSVARTMFTCLSRLFRTRS